MLYDIGQTYMPHKHRHPLKNKKASKKTEKLTIATKNIRGKAKNTTFTSKKRWINNLISQNIDIIFLQETKLRKFIP